MKSPEGGQQIYYPIAPKTLVPNLQARNDGQCIAGNMKVHDVTANALRNVERNQWKTTYDLNHTGTALYMYMNAVWLLCMPTTSNL